jgi:hypothetical protein
MSAHRAHVGPPTLTQDAICSGTPAERGRKKLLCTALLGYPAAISAALERTKIIFAQPRPIAVLPLNCEIVSRK